MNPAFYSLATVAVVTLSLATTEPAVATDAPALAKAASDKPLRLHMQALRNPLLP